MAPGPGGVEMAAMVSEVRAMGASFRENRQKGRGVLQTGAQVKFV